MKVNKKTLENLEKLARLDLSLHEKKNMLQDLSKILDFVEKLNEINTDRIDPLIHVHKKSNIYRQDIDIKMSIKEEVLKNAPNNNSDYIKVPKVVNKK